MMEPTNRRRSGRHQPNDGSNVEGMREAITSYMANPTQVVGKNNFVGFRELGRLKDSLVELESMQGHGMTERKVASSQKKNERTHKEAKSQKNGRTPKDAKLQKNERTPKDAKQSLRTREDGCGNFEQMLDEVKEEPVEGCTLSAAGMETVTSVATTIGTAFSVNTGDEEDSKSELEEIINRQPSVRLERLSMSETDHQRNSPISSEMSSGTGLVISEVVSLCKENVGTPKSISMKGNVGRPPKSTSGSYKKEALPSARLVSTKVAKCGKGGQPPKKKKDYVKHLTYVETATRNNPRYEDEHVVIQEPKYGFREKRQTKGTWRKMLKRSCPPDDSVKFNETKVKGILADSKSREKLISANTRAETFLSGEKKKSAEKKRKEKKKLSKVKATKVSVTCAHMSKTVCPGYKYKSLNTAQTESDGVHEDSEPRLEQTTLCDIVEAEIHKFRQKGSEALKNKSSDKLRQIAAETCPQMMQLLCSVGGSRPSDHLDAGCTDGELSILVALAMLGQSHFMGPGWNQVAQYLGLKQLLTAATTCPKTPSLFPKTNVELLLCLSEAMKAVLSILTHDQICLATLFCQNNAELECSEMVMQLTKYLQHYEGEKDLKYSSLIEPNVHPKMPRPKQNMNGRIKGQELEGPSSDEDWTPDLDMECHSGSDKESLATSNAFNKSKVSTRVSLNRSKFESSRSRSSKRPPPKVVMSSNPAEILVKALKPKLDEQTQPIGKVRHVVQQSLLNKEIVSEIKRKKSKEVPQVSLLKKDVRRDAEQSASITEEASSKKMVNSHTNDGLKSSLNASDTKAAGTPEISQNNDGKSIATRMQKERDSQHFTDHSYESNKTERNNLPALHLIPVTDEVVQKDGSAVSQFVDRIIEEYDDDSNASSGTSSITPEKAGPSKCETSSFKPQSRPDSLVTNEAVAELPSRKRPHEDIEVKTEVLDVHEVHDVKDDEDLPLPNKRQKPRASLVRGLKDKVPVASKEIFVKRKTPCAEFSRKTDTAKIKSDKHITIPKRKEFYHLPDELREHSSKEKRTHSRFGQVTRTALCCCLCWDKLGADGGTMALLASQLPTFTSEFALLNHWRETHCVRQNGFMKISCPRCPAYFGCGEQTCDVDIQAAERAVLDHLIHCHRVPFPWFYTLLQCSAPGCTYVAVTQELHELHVSTKRCPDPDNKWWVSFNPDVELPPWPPKQCQEVQSQLKNMDTITTKVKTKKGYSTKPMIRSIEITIRAYPCCCILCELDPNASRTVIDDESDMFTHMELRHVVKGLTPQGGSISCTQCAKKFKWHNKNQRLGVLSALGNTIQHHVTFHNAAIPHNVQSCKCPHDSCTDYFVIGQALIRHFDAVHCPPVACNVCDAIVSRAALYGHYRAKHYRTAGTIGFCVSCPERTFVKSSGMQGHILHYHEGARKHKCHICQSSFYSNSYLNKHLFQIHRINRLNKKVLKCQDCDFETINIALLKIHRNRHVTAPQFACTSCDKAFKFRAGLDVHRQQVHGGKDIQQCPYCDYSTKKGKRMLFQHLAVQHAVVSQVLRCPAPTCRYATTNQEYLIRHKAKCAVWKKAFPTIVPASEQVEDKDALHQSSTTANEAVMALQSDMTTSPAGHQAVQVTYVTEEIGHTQLDGSTSVEADDQVTDTVYYVTPEDLARLTSQENLSPDDITRILNTNAPMQPKL